MTWGTAGLYSWVNVKPFFSEKLMGLSTFSLHWLTRNFFYATNQLKFGLFQKTQFDVWRNNELPPHTAGVRRGFIERGALNIEYLHNRHPSQSRVFYRVVKRYRARRNVTQLFKCASPDYEKVWNFVSDTHQDPPLILISAGRFRSGTFYI